MSSKSLDINTLEYKPIDSNYGFVTYNGIDLYVSSDKQWFNAFRLTNSLKSYLSAHPPTPKRYAWGNLIDAYPDMFREVNGKGTQAYKGWFASIELLQIIACLAEPVRGLAWIRNEPWQDSSLNGVLYLLQPLKYIGTNIFKIGETKNIFRRLNNNDYGRGTQVYGIIRTTNRRQAEHILIKYFKDNGAILREGYEYFELNGLDEAKRLFSTAPLGGLYDRSFREVINLYQSSEWINGEIVPDSFLSPTIIENPIENEEEILDDSIFEQ